MSRDPVALIDVEALRHNFQICRRFARGRRVTAVIKANAYGHGLLATARALKEADAFGLSCYDEALTLRRAGIDQRIVLLEGFHAVNEIATAHDPAIDWVLHHAEQLQALAALPASAARSVWLKVDSGMGRLGFRPEEIPAAVAHLQALGERVQLKGFVTHLACADDRANPMTKVQLERFEQATAPYPGERSIANSAGMLAWPVVQGDWVRPGIMLYGVSPFADDHGSDYALRPVMTFKTRLISIRACRKGDTISYGGTYVCPSDGRMGIVAVGYGDGYPRHIAPVACVVIRGVRVPIIGRVTMDMLCVSLDQLEEAQIDDEVTLWGEGLPIEEVARWSGTIAYELLCQVTGRVRQEVRHG